MEGGKKWKEQKILTAERSPESHYNLVCSKTWKSKQTKTWACLYYQWSYSGTSKSRSDWRAAEGPQNLVSRVDKRININKCKTAHQVGKTLCAQLTIRTAWKILQKKLHHEPSIGYQPKKGKYGFRTTRRRKTQNFVILHSVLWTDCSVSLSRSEESNGFNPVKGKMKEKEWQKWKAIMITV